MTRAQTPLLDLRGEYIEEFYRWCLQGASQETCKRYIHYIQSCLPNESSNRWCLTAWKKFLKFLCSEKLIDEACLEYTRVKIPKSKPDIYVPSDEEVKRALGDAHYGWFYRVLVESGLRVEEAARLVASKPRCVRIDGFVRCELNWLRGSKRALWAYLLEEPPHKPVWGLARRVSAYAYKHGLIAPKYVRKWVAMKMVELGIPESVVDFIQGRAPSKILATHYLNLLVQADKWYKVYAQWLRNQGLV